MNPTDLQRWLRQSIYDAPNSDSRKRILDEYVQGLIAIARAAAVYRDFVLNGRDNGVGELEARGDLFRALDQLETDNG